MQEQDETGLVGADEIMVGRALAYSIYRGDRQLLLAKGEVVESDQMRQLLLRYGQFQSHSTSLRLEEGAEIVVSSPPATGQTSEAAEAKPAAPVVGPLELYESELQKNASDARVAVRMSLENTAENYLGLVLGTHEPQGFIVSAPLKPDKSLVDVREGQTWIFRMLHMTAAVKFHGTILNVQAQPTPLLFVAPKSVEMRRIRTSPRVATCVRGRMLVRKPVPVLILDLSADGVCAAADVKLHKFEVGQSLPLEFSLLLQYRDYPLRLPATVVGLRPELMSQYPELSIAGLKLEPQTDIDRLALHGYLYERMAMSIGPVWRVLLASQEQTAG